MQITFGDLIGKIFQIYLDDLIIYSRNQQDHFDHLRKVFLHCKKFGMSLNPTQSIFGVTQGKIIGHIVSDSRISIDRERVITIQDLQAPSSKKKFNLLWEKSILLEYLFPILLEWLNQFIIC
jgi:hypothetical protein